MLSHRHHILGSLSVIVAGLGFGSGGVIGCGGSNEVPAAPSGAANATCVGDCECVGDTCKCRTGGTCTFGTPPSTAGDGGTGTPGSAPPPPDNVTYECEAKNTCNATCGTGCTTSCAGQSTCEGSCSSNCTSTCTGTSECNLSTGQNSKVTCGGASTCNLSVDTGTTVACEGTSKCQIQCPKGGCTAECSGASTCTIECGEAAACTIACNGGRSETCAAGTTCTNPCGGGGGGGGGGKGG